MTNETATHQSTPTRTYRATRQISVAGRLCVAGGLVAAAGATVSATLHPAMSPDAMSYPFTPRMFQVCEVLWTVTHLLTLAGVVALGRSGLIGDSRWGTIGQRIALVGMVLMIPAEFGFVFLAHSSVEAAGSAVLDGAIGFAAVLAGIGLTIVGIATIGSGSWTGWGRYTPLLAGTFVLLILLPVQAVHPAALPWAIAGWNLYFVLLGAALVGQARQTIHPPPPPH